MSLTDTVLAQTVDKDDGGDGGADRVPGLCENVVAILSLYPLDLGGWLGAIGRHIFFLEKESGGKGVLLSEGMKKERDE